MSKHDKHKRQTRRKPPLVLRWLRFSLKLQSTISKKLAGWRMYRLWFKSPKHPEPIRERNWRKQAKYLPVDHPDGPIAVYHWGKSDKRVLLIHGWSGRGAQLGRFVQPLLDEGYAVIAFDAPGHGRTPGHTSSIFRITDALLAVVAQTGIPDAVITHSFGAMVLAYALKHTDFNTHKAVCISSPTTPLFLVDRFCDVMQVDGKVKREFKHFVEKRFGLDVWDKLAADKNVAGCNIPALIIHDEDDHDVPYELGQQLSDAWPNAQLHLTKGLGHRRILRNNSVARLAAEFITG